VRGKHSSLTVTFESSLDGDDFCYPSISEESDDDGDLIGVARCQSLLSVGRHFMTFTVVDSDDLGSQATMYLDVLNEDDIDDDGDGETENEGDCDDQDPSINSNGNEVADGIDNNCDGNIDEGDDDYDGFTEEQGDCDDANTGINPGATELPNGIDDDCDGLIDESTSGGDDDGDGYSESAGDCDDADPNINPDEDEVCDALGIDENCDGLTDELNADGCSEFYQDADQDGFGASSVASVCTCEAGGVLQYSQYTATDATDCQDSNADVFPGQTLSFGTPYSTAFNQSSYDYNCDGIEEKDLESLGECMCDSNPDPDNATECTTLVLLAAAGQGDCGLKNNQIGWLNSVPACGGTGQILADTSDCIVDAFLAVEYWLPDADVDYFCVPNPSSVVYLQGCK
jgi:hypothetical protein